MRYGAGELTERITVQRDVIASDGAGGQTTTSSTLCTVWAKVKPKGGAERVEGQRLGAQAMCTFVIRYRSDLKESDRIVWGGVEYNIRYIPVLSGHQMFLEVEAERGAAQ